VIIFDLDKEFLIWSENTVSLRGCLKS
jgi:hypothetical protein